MIAKSDLFILVVSASLLAVGIYRWQNNLSVMAANAAKQTQQAITTSNTTAVGAVSNAPAAAPTTISTVSSVQTSAATVQTNVSNVQAPVLVNTPQTTSNVVVNAAGELTTNAAVTNIVENNRPLFGSHIAISGDYLSKIAQQYGTTVQTLQQINNLNGTLIEVGQEIKYPLPAN